MNEDLATGVAGKNFGEWFMISGLFSIEFGRIFLEFYAFKTVRHSLGVELKPLNAPLSNCTTYIEDDHSASSVPMLFGRIGIIGPEHSNLSACI